MKSREDFINAVQQKADVRRAEIKRRKKTVTAFVSAAACLVLIVGAVGTDIIGNMGSKKAEAMVPGNEIGQLPEGETNMDHEGAYNRKTADGEVYGEIFDYSENPSYSSNALVYHSGAFNDGPILYTEYDIREEIQNLCFDLFSANAKTDQNYMLSPISLISALTMAQNGAAGDTRAQMEAMSGLDTDTVNLWLSIWSDNTRSNNGRTRFNVANSFWISDAGTVNARESYLRQLGTYYKAELFRVPFDSSTVSDVNKWCENETYGMIKKLVDDFDPNIRAMIVNAVAFEGKWCSDYEDRDIEEGQNFTCAGGEKAEVTMLNSVEDNYLENDDVEGFIKSYKDGFGIMLLLPKLRDGMTPDEAADNAVRRLSGETYRRLCDTAKWDNVETYAKIPEFKAEYTANDLNELLRGMGIRDAFDPARADFSAMAEGDRLFISKVIQKTYIELNREGTRAAAATGITFGTCSVGPDEPPEVHYVYLDRPFIYVIFDQDTMTPIFTGVYSDASV